MNPDGRDVGGRAGDGDRVGEAAAVDVEDDLVIVELRLSVRAVARPT